MTAPGANPRIVQAMPTIKSVTAHLGSGASFRYKDRTLPGAGLEVYTANWTDIDGGDIYPGRSFTFSENATAQRVVIVNAKLAEKLFGDSDPMDKTIQINGVPFVVIGVYHYTASPMGTPTSAGGGDTILSWDTEPEAVHVSHQPFGAQPVDRDPRGTAREERVDEQRHHVVPGQRPDGAAAQREAFGEALHAVIRVGHVVAV